MKPQIRSYLSSFAVILLITSRYTASSQTCNSQGNYCVSSTSFLTCIDGDTTPPPQAVQQCPPETQCQSTCPFCTHYTELPCPECNAQRFYCSSTTAYQECIDFDNLPYAESISCQGGTICDMTCKYPCQTDKPCFTCTEPTRYPVPGNNKAYYLCTVINGVVTINQYSCSGSAHYDDSSKTCTTLTTTSTLSTTSTTSTTTTPTTISTTSTTTTPTTTSTTTPTTTLSTTSTTTPTTTTTTTAVTTTKPAVTPFTCTTTGTFINPDDCKKYYVCYDSGNGILTRYNQSCPAAQYYDAVKNHCEKDSAVCAGTAVRPLSLRMNLFTCVEAGLFEDTSCCRGYRFCSMSDKGGFYETSYSCPLDAVFNPYIERCVHQVDYTCNEEGC